MKHLKPLFLFSLALLCACAAPRNTASTGKNKSNAAQNEEQSINATYAFFNAVKEKLTGNDAKAAEGFAACLRIDPKNHAAMYELASIYSNRNKYNDALFFARSAYEADPSNVWYALLLGDIYEKAGKYTDAEKIYQKLTKDDPNHIDYYFNLADVQLSQNKFQEAIRTYDQVEQHIGTNRELVMQKERLYLRLGKVEDAAAEVEKLIQSDPSNIDNYSLLLDLYQVNNFPDKTMAVIKRMQAIDPDHPSIALGLAEYHRNKGEREESFNQLKKAFTSPILPSEVKIRILTSYLPLAGDNPEMLDQALTLSKIMSEVHPTEANPQAVYGDFLLIGKKPEQARIQYRSSIQLDKKNMQAWQQLLITESELRDFNAMLTESDEAISLYAEQSIFYLFNGIAHTQLKQYEEAAKVLQTGSKLVVDNDAQQIEFYSNLGDVYNNLKKFEESDKYYEKALRIDPNNSYVLNNYSYYLSLRGEQLEKAADMAKKANELNPKNSNYEDTYGWVLYKQGKYTEALAIFEAALENGGGDNGTIVEHYGDVLFRLGRIGEAIIQWQKAKATGDHSPLIDKKITDRKLYE